MLLFWFIGCIIVAVAANGRGRSGIGWFFLSILISPILGLILVLVMENRGTPEPPRHTVIHLKEPQRPQLAEKPVDSPLAQIERLALLREKGYLTETEFEEQKQEVLRWATRHRSG